jgi:hypothetical protein
MQLITTDAVLNFINAATMLPFVWIAFQTKHRILTAAIVLFMCTGIVHHVAKLLKKQTMGTFLLDVISQLMMLYIITTYSPYLKNNHTTQSIRVFLLAGISVLLIVQVVGVKYSKQSTRLSSWFILLFYLSVTVDARQYLRTGSVLSLVGCLASVVTALLYPSLFFPAWYALHVAGWFALYYVMGDLKLI